MSILGTRVVRTEDPRLLTSGGIYVDDLTEPRLVGAAFVTFVRSSQPHARILGIDSREAGAADGVVAVLTGADLDLPPLPPAFDSFNQAMGRPLLAADVVRYVGEPVAMVITETRYQGEDAAERVDIDYDALPAVVAPEDALRDEVLLFPAAGTNLVTTFSDGALDDSLFDGCEVVVRQRIVNQRVAPAPLEGRAVACAWGEDGRLTLWTSTQHAQGVRDEAAAALGVEPSVVHVITPDVGGGFGAKTGATSEDVLLSWASKRLGRPLRWSETRSENLLSMTHGRAQVQHVALGGSRDGRLAAYQLDILADAGAYPYWGAALPELTRMMAPGVYALQKVASAARAVVTNTATTAAYRGAGRPEATAAIERAVDLFAAEIGMDPAEVRRRNLLPADAFPHDTGTGAVYDCGDYPGALARALEAAGYAELRAEQSRRRAAGEVCQLGIGLSVYVEITGEGSETSRVRLTDGGGALVLTGTSPHGQGHGTAWAMIVSDATGIPLDRIEVVHGDTDLIPLGGGTMGSRSLQIGGVALQAATADLVVKARERAAELIEANPADLVVDPAAGGFSVRGSPDAIATWAALAAGGELTGEAFFEAPGPTFPFGAHVAVVEVDVESGRAELVRMIAVDDSGTILNPLLAEGQRHGGLAQGIGQALLEEVVYDPDGNPLTTNFADYGFISATELPSFELVPMQTPTPHNALGAKGIGESGTIGSTPAVQNAVIDAVAHLGVRHIDMPLTPERVWTAIRAAAGQGRA